MVNRLYYMNILNELIDNKLVKLLIGVRRSGKSTLLKLLQDHLVKNKISKSRIIQINFEMMEYDDLKNGKDFHEFIKSKIKTKDKYYLFIDEIQEVEDWARVINSINNTFNIDIYITGSNARAFSGEHLTYLAGRYISIPVFPLSYDEYLNFIDKNNEYGEHYNDFLDSSFPAIVLEPRINIKNMMKQDLFETIFQRDILLRGKIQNEDLFFRVARFVLEHIGATISVKKICDILNSNNMKISYDAVENYINLMSKSFFLYHCKRYEIKGKEILKTNGKYYVVDFGIRQKLVPNSVVNTGRILENFIYLELVKKGYEVYVGKIGRDYEIDFVAIKNNKKYYVQVSESIVDEQTRESEIRPFNYINDLSERIIVTADLIKYYSDKFNHYNIFEFLKIL